MSTLTGTITTVLLNNEILSQRRAFSLNLPNKVIIWDSEVPPELQNITLGQLRNNPSYNISYAVTNNIRGLQYYDLSQPELTLEMTIGGGFLPNRTYRPNAPGVTGLARYDINDTYEVASFPTTVGIAATNICLQGNCTQYPVYNTFYTLILMIRLTNVPPPEPPPPPPPPPQPSPSNSFLIIMSIIFGIIFIGLIIGLIVFIFTR